MTGYKRTVTRAGAATVAAALAGAVTGYLAARLAGRPDGLGEPGAVGVVVGVGAVLGAIYLAMAVHELGHALAGFAQGFRFVLWAVGPLMVIREAGRLRLRANRTAALWGGLTVTVPTSTDRVVRRFAWAVAGGPVMSLLLAALAGAALPRTFGVARLFFGVVAAVSAGIVLVTVQPFGAGGGFASDGARLLRLLRGGEAGAQEAAILSLYAFALGGVRPRDWPAGQVETALRRRDSGPFEAAVCVMAAQHYLDGGEVERAGEAFDRVLALWPGLHEVVRASLAADLAFFLAFVRGDASKAEELLAEAKGPLVESHRVLRAQAAVRLALGDPNGALDAAVQAREAMARPLLEASAMDDELVSALVQRARAAHSARV